MQDSNRVYRTDFANAIAELRERDVQGFLLSGGAFTTFHFPDSEWTRVGGINNKGEIVGHYASPNGAVHGFLLSGGEFSSIDYPGATYTQPLGINIRGEMVGLYVDAPGTHGFVAGQLKGRP